MSAEENHTTREPEEITSGGERPQHAVDQARRRVFFFCHDPAVFAELHVAADLVTTVVAGGAIGIESNQSRQPAGAAVHFVDDLFVIDAFEQLPSERHAGRFTPLPELVEKAVGDQLQPLLDQLVVNFALLLDLFRGLELRGKAGLELAEADIVEAGGIDVVSGDPPGRLLTHLDCTINGPVGVLRVVDGNENLAVHRYLRRAA